MPVQTPIKVDFGEQENLDLKKFVKDRLQAEIDAWDNLHTSKVPEWRRLYKGQPESESKDFPWPGCSNTVIQLIAENADILKARVIGTIYEILPLWVASIVGDWSEGADGDGENQRLAMEAFLNLMGMEPSELDLYRVESLAANDMVQFGSVLIKLPWETDTEKLVTGTSATSRGLPAAVDHIKYDGPRPEKVPIEDWGATASAPTWEKADFKYHKYTLHKQDIERKIYEGSFKETEGKAILASPDRHGPSSAETEKEKLQNIEAQHSDALAEWDIYECWFWYWHNDAKWRIIYLYHQGTDTELNSVFNFYPNNEEPFEYGRLGYTDDGLRGYGFAEMLKYYQEEVSTGHNQRNDNRTLGNTSVATVGKNNKIDANLSIYPMAVLPISAEDFGLHQLGVAYPSSVDEEMMTISLAKSRAGTDEPATQGMGGSTPNKKGQLTAMGTFSVMQSGNRRVNVNITDFRYLHLKLGRKFSQQYAHFGVGDRLQKFGKQAQFIKMALDNIKRGKIELPIRAANASINKEIEKQNDMLLTQVLQRHHSSIAQILQGLGNPGMPPEMKEFLIGVINASGQLMSNILRNFGKDDIARLQPELKVVKALQQAQQQQQVQQAQQGPPQQGANPNEGPEQGIQSPPITGPPQNSGQQLPI
jgi:hypothetical protein